MPADPAAIWTQTEPVRGSASMVIALAAVAAMAAVVIAIVLQRRRHDADLDAFARRHGFDPLPDDPADPVYAAVAALFGQGPRIERLLHRQAPDMNLYLVRLRMPLYRVDAGGIWDATVQESQVKLVLLAANLAAPLPIFRLMPNSWALTAVRGEEANLVHGVEPLGWRNYVLGDDEAWVLHVLAGEPSHLLRRNQQLTLDSRGDVLAFYLQDERPQPRDLAAFVDHCLALAHALLARARIYPASLPAHP